MKTSPVYLRFLTLGLTALLCLAACGAGAPPPGGLKVGEIGQVAEVTSGDTLRLKSGLSVRLVGIDSPPVNASDQFGVRAKEALRALVAGKTVELRYGGLTKSKTQQALAQVFVRNGKDLVWVQPEMLKRGLAMVHSYDDNRAGVNAMYVAEREARLAKRGIWSSPVYAVKAATPVALAKAGERFQIVEGVVVQAASRGNNIYLNFGDDYRTDVTATVPLKTMHRWLGGAAAVTALQGRRIRVRGKIGNYNGPSIYVSHPEQIELIGAAKAG